MHIPQHGAMISDATRNRIRAIDASRGIALIAMTIYHFAFDLELFGLLEPATTATGAWKWFARCIAGSFLFLVGVSLVLAHGDKALKALNWKKTLRRLVMIATGAIVITITTWFATPGQYIFFGILHQIAAASLLGLLFLRMPWWAIAVLSLFILISRTTLQTEWLNHPAFYWTGLQTTIPRSSDYVPMFPWFGMVLLGMATAKLATQTAIIDRLSTLQMEQKPARALRFIGRHSLAYYLLHQPIMLVILVPVLWITGYI